MASSRQPECTGDSEAVGDGQEAKEERKDPVFFKRHIKYFERVLNCLPCSLSKLDSNRYG